MLTHPQARNEPPQGNSPEMDRLALWTRNQKLEADMKTLKNELNEKDSQINKLEAQLEQQGKHSEASPEKTNKTPIKRNKLEEQHSKVGWISSTELCHILRICKRTLQNYRDQDLIPFSRRGGKIFYNLQEVEEALKSKGVYASKHIVKNSAMKIDGLT